MVNKTFFGNTDIVPVVMFHSVGAEGHDWILPIFQKQYPAFESTIRPQQTGVKFITWSDLNQVYAA